MAVPIGLQNLRAFDVTINDLGLILGASQTVMLTSTFDSDYLRASSNLFDSITNDDVLIYDGTVSLDKQASLDFMVGRLAGAEKEAVEEVATVVTSTATHAIVPDDANVTVASGINTVSIGLANTISVNTGVFATSLTISGHPVLTDSSLSYIHTQVSPASTWNITHNLNSENPLVQVYNTQDVVIQPNQITATNANSLTLVFNQSVSGTASVLKVGSAALIGGLFNVVEDLTPQLGGQLDTNGFSIAGNNVKIQPANTGTIELFAGDTTFVNSSPSAGEIYLHSRSDTGNDANLTLDNAQALVYCNSGGTSTITLNANATNDSTITLLATGESADILLNANAFDGQIRLQALTVTGTEFRTGGTIRGRTGTFAHSLTVSGVPVNISASSGDFLASGSVPMTGTFKAANGSAAAPSITFNSDQDTGFYRLSDNTLGVTTSGNRMLVLSGTGKATPEHFRFLQGALGFPAEFSNRNATDTGYDRLLIRGAELEIEGMDGGDVDIFTDVPGTSVRMKTLASGCGVVVSAEGPNSILSISTTDENSYISIAAGGDGGFVVLSGDNIGITANGTGGDILLTADDNLTISAGTAVTSNAPVRTTAGTAPIPSHSFTADTDTGIYRVAENILGVAAEGTTRVTISGANATTSGLGVAGNITGNTITGNRGVFDTTLTISGVPVTIRGLKDIVEDLTPQLGGHLETRGYSITSTGVMFQSSGDNFTISAGIAASMSAGSTLNLSSDSAMTFTSSNGEVGAFGGTTVRLDAPTHVRFSSPVVTGTEYRTGGTVAGRSGNFAHSLTVSGVAVPISPRVDSLNTLTGAVLLGQGANITITPVGNTLTIASSASGGSTPNAIVGAGGLSVVSGSNTTVISSKVADAIIGTGGTTVTSGSNQVQVSSQIDKALVGSSFVNVLSGTNTNTIIADAIISDSANLTVTSGTDRVTLSPSATPSYTSISADTGAFTNTLTVSGSSVMHTGITGVTVSGLAVNKGQLNFVGSRASNVSIVGNTITIDSPPDTTAAGGAGITAIVQDLTPQLGGNLNAAGFNITGGGVYRATTLSGVTVTGTTAEFSGKVSGQSGEFPYSLTVSGKPAQIWSKDKFTVANSNGLAANVALTNMAAAANFFGISGAMGAINKVDAGGKCQVRLQGNVTVSGVVNSAARLRAKIGPYTQTIANYTDVLVTGSLMLTMKKEMVGTWQDTGWWSLRPEFRRDDVYFCVSVSGGDGAADPAWGGMFWEIR